MKKLLACLTVLLLTSPMPVIAGTNTFFTAAWLRELCFAKKNTQEFLTCAIYIRGFLEGQEIARIDLLARIDVMEKIESPKKGNRKAEVPTEDEMENLRYAAYCIPKSVVVTQLTEIFVKHMNEPPEKLHESASGELHFMLARHFPCQFK